MFSGAKHHLRLLGPRGLAFVLQRKIVRRPGIFTVRRPDCPHPIYLRIPSSDTPTYQQVFVKREYDFEVGREPRVIVDAGANIGLATVYFASRFPRARILAIEPEDDNFALLTRNVAPYPNVLAIHAALWNRNEEINLVDPGLGHWGFMTEGKQEPGHPEQYRHAVHALTVDQLIRDHALPTIDLLKIDIEGAEKEVFTDASAWIGKVDAIIIELHERLKRGCNRAFYRGTEGFDLEWMRGENIFLSRGNGIRPLTS